MKRARKSLHYCEIFCTKRGELFKTGQGAAGITMAETRELFERARKYAVPIKSSTFLVDLHDEEGNLVDTICINGRGFRALTGAKPPTLAEARRTDSAYWAAAKERRGWKNAQTREKGE